MSQPLDCAAARDSVWPPNRPRLADADAIAAREHIAGCAACRAYFAQDRALLDVYDRLRATPAPPAVRERVFDALARERTGHGQAAQRDRRARRDGTPLRAAVVALLALAAGFAGWFAVAGDRAPDPPALFAEDWLRRAVAADHIETADPAAIRDFLARELGIAHTPPSMPGHLPVRAEICLLDGRRGAMITYADGDQTLAHYVLPATGAVRRAPAVARSAGAGEGLTIVTWAEASLEHALVGHLPGDSLLILAARQ